MVMKTERSCGFKANTFIVAVILFLVVLAVYHGYYKEYLYEDEVLSYTIANSPRGGFINMTPGEFYSGEDLFSNTYVEKGHEFNYAVVIANHKTDAHPPLYGLLLHTLCSFGSGGFSKWFGIVLNLILYAVVLVLIYLITLELFPDRPFFSAFVCLVFGLTTGMIHLAIFIRMYILLMVLTTYCMYWHIKALRCPVSFSSSACLCLSTFAGAMTHYFYLIFAFFAACFFLIYKMKKAESRKKDILYYIGSMLAAGGLFLLSWHQVIFNMLTLDAASDLSSQKLTIGLMARKIIQMVRDVNSDLFGNRLKYLVIVVVLFGIYLIFANKDQLKVKINIKAEFVLIIFVNLFFFIVVSAITPYLSTRYISPTFPFVILITILILEQITNEVMRFPILGLAVILIFFITPEAEVLQKGLMDVNRQIIDEISSEQKENLCLFDTRIASEENVFELRKFNKIYVYNGENAECAAEEISKADKVVVYVPNDMEPEEYTRNIREINPNLINLDRLYVAYYSAAYLLHD